MSLFKAYFCQTEFTPGSQLTDGKAGKPFKIEGSTWLVWFDLKPGYRFRHPTAYMFITRKGKTEKIRVQQGQRWPVLDGEGILFEGAGSAPSQINCYFFPDVLTDNDELYDGEKGPKIDISGPTQLIWVDLQPGAEFGHPTVYVFVSAAGIQIKRGNDKPTLNGVEILYGTNEPITMELPLTVEIPAPDQ